MTTEEFSNEFDTLLNSYSTKVEFGILNNLEFNEYEKSVFLTLSQEDILLSIYKGNDAYGNSFESTEENRRYLNDLIKTYTSIRKITSDFPLTNKSAIFELPTDVWFITYESVDFEDISLQGRQNEDIPVVPTTQDEFNRIKNNPFKSQNSRRVLRLDSGGNKVELVSNYKLNLI